MKRLGTMRTTTEARKQLDRLMRAHLHGEIETQTFRNLTYAFSIMLSYFKQETEEKQEVKEAENKPDPLMEMLGKALGKIPDDTSRASN